MLGKPSQIHLSRGDVLTEVSQLHFLTEVTLLAEPVSFTSRVTLRA